MLIEWGKRQRKVAKPLILIHRKCGDGESSMTRHKDQRAAFVTRTSWSLLATWAQSQVPPIIPTPAAIHEWLVHGGPLWGNGVSQITVIAGIRDTQKALEVLVFDPALPHKKHGEWRRLFQWYELDGHSGRATGAAVQTIFLQLP